MLDMYGTDPRIEWLTRELERWSYKPGWRLSVSNNMFMPHFMTSFKCEDTYNPGSMIEPCKATPLFRVPIHDEDVFARWLAREVRDVEIHESREWLKRDGKIYDDPHA